MAPNSPPPETRLPRRDEGHCVSLGAAAALVAAWVLVGLLPGLMLLIGLRPGAGWLRTMLLAPVASYGLVMAVAVAMQLLGR